MLAALWPAVPHWNAAAAPPSLNRTLLWSFENATAAHLWRRSRWSMLLYAWDVEQVVQDAVAAWGENSDARTRQASGSPDVVVGVEALPRHVIASTRRLGAGRARVVLSASKCWFVHDARACRAMREHRLGVLVGIGFALGCAGGVAVVRAPLRIAAASAAFAVALFAAAYVAPCFACHSLFTTVAHEFGHVLGLGHADAAGGVCGCGVRARRCAGAPPAPAVMDSVSNAFGCLQRDDVDAVRTLHGGACAAPVACRAPPALLTAHAGVAALYALVLAGALRACRRVAFGPRKDLTPDDVFLRAPDT